MTRKDYIELVDIFGKFTAMVGTDNVKINEQSQQAIQTYIRFLMSDIYKLLKRDNSRFDESKFIREYDKMKNSWIEYFLEQANKDNKYL